MRELARLRRRFILILMCSVGLVLTVALVAFVVSSFSTQEGRIQRSLSTALSIQGGEELRPHIGGFDEQRSSNAEPDPADSADSANSGMGHDAPPHDIPREDPTNMVPVFVVDISQDNDVITSYGSAADMDKETLLEALSHVEQGTNSSGLLLDLGLLYTQQSTPDGATRIAFADASHLYNSTLNQALLALLIWALSMVAFFALSLWLSRMALKPVEEAWDKQRRFIADASHELKTPLTIILANNNIIQSHPEKTTAEQEPWLESTEKEANRMNDMVTDLLLLAQLESTWESSNKTSTDKDDVIAVESREDASKNMVAKSSLTPLDLSALVERSLLQFDAVFFERGIHTKADVAKGLRINGNQEHMRRLIDILLDNASKYGTEGSQVCVRLTRSTNKAPAALLTVANSGELIPSAKIDQIFERFYRGDAAHSSTTPGSGLGLALAQEIVREHGGSIQVTSIALEAFDSPESSGSPWPLLPSESSGSGEPLESSESSRASVPSASSEVTEPDGKEPCALTTFSVVLPLI